MLYICSPQICCIMYVIIDSLFIIVTCTYKYKYRIPDNTLSCTQSYKDVYVTFTNYKYEDLHIAIILIKFVYFSIKLEISLAILTLSII